MVCTHYKHMAILEEDERVVISAPAHDNLVRTTRNPPTSGLGQATAAAGRFSPDSFSTSFSEQSTNARGIFFLDRVVSQLASQALSPGPHVA